MRVRRIFMLFAAAATGFGLGTPSRALASGRFYLDVGAGLSQIRNSGPLFSSSPPIALGMGLAAQLAAAYEVIPSGNGQMISLHIGAQYRYASGYGTDNQRYYGLQSLYPVIRIEGNHLAHLTLGWTPAVLVRDSDVPGFDLFRKPIGVWGMMAEAGYAWPLTPAVSLIPTLGVQAFRVGGEYAPKPSIEGTLVLRFYIDASKSFEPDRKSGSMDSKDYQGWRYPFGLEGTK